MAVGVGFWDTWPSIRFILHKTDIGIRAAKSDGSHATRLGLCTPFISSSLVCRGVFINNARLREICDRDGALSERLSGAD